MARDSQTYDVSVVIPTFRRPDWLMKTIDSVATQKNAIRISYEIIIVDNSSEKSAEVIVARLAEKYKVPIRYVSEPQQNIALARNAGINHSTAEFVAMIDDDERAKPDWLDQLVGTIRKFDADAVLGPTIPVFERELPDWFGHNLDAFVRNRSIPTGSELDRGSTAQALMRASACFANGNRFDPELGRTGGSDTDFFMRLARVMGRKIVWCNEAVVEEHIPVSRLKVGYLLRRELRGNQVFVNCSVKYSAHPVLTAVYLTFIVGFVQAATWLVPCLITAPFETAYSYRAKRMLVRGLGKLFWGKSFRPNLY